MSYFVLFFIQTFSTECVGRAETIIGLAAQADEAVILPFYLEQAGGSLVMERTCNATWLGGDPLAAGQSTCYVENHSDLFLK